MTDMLAALLLGIIECITEFLPISSTGHLLIAERWLGHRSDLFNIAIQAGAILAVVAIYRQRLCDLLLGFGVKSGVHAHDGLQDRIVIHCVTNGDLERSIELHPGIDPHVGQIADQLGDEPDQREQEQRAQHHRICTLYTSPSPRDLSTSRMPSLA